MSKFLSSRFDCLSPYVPGEQPKDKNYIKLNANENPFAPSPKVKEAIKNFDAEKLKLYFGSDNTIVCNAVAKQYNIKVENIFAGNGSDEVLAFIFMAFFDKQKCVCYPDISYGFYSVYAELFGLTKNEIALKDDFSIDLDAFIKSDNAVVIANPNAPTGIALTASDVEKLISSKPDRLVVIDEAYVDFGGESVVNLINKYKNLIVVQTLSKSRSLAGARIGFAIADEELICDIKKMKYSFNSYNVNCMTECVATAAIEDVKYFEKCTKEIIENREWTTRKLKALGFEVLPSSANFVFARTSEISGLELYQAIKDNGVLIRHFNKPRISEFLRITIGTEEQMEKLLLEIKNILNK